MDLTDFYSASFEVLSVGTFIKTDNPREVEESIFKQAVKDGYGREKPFEYLIEPNRYFGEVSWLCQKKVANPTAYS